MQVRKFYKPGILTNYQKGKAEVKTSNVTLSLAWHRLVDRKIYTYVDTYLHICRYIFWKYLGVKNNYFNSSTYQIPNKPPYLNLWVTLRKKSTSVDFIPEWNWNHKFYDCITATINHKLNIYICCTWQKTLYSGQRRAWRVVKSAPVLLTDNWLIQRLATA